MKAILLREKKNRLLFSKTELSRKTLKYLLANTFLSLDVRWVVGFTLEKLSHQGNFAKLHGRCVQTNRGRSIIKRFRLSRISFRSFSRSGQLVGVVKKSW
jgi:small subunit ribosomal protein S14